MENPLIGIVDIQEREDGLYLKVDRNARDSIQLKAIENRLKEALVTNYDLHQIADVVKRGRGLYEKIGPLFEYYNLSFDAFISVKVNPMKAILRVDSGALAAGLRLSESIILYTLKRNGIRYGIKPDVIRRLVKEALFDTELVVAEGLAPEQGVDAKMLFEAKIDPDSRPQLDRNGRVNFRDIKTFTTVKEGQIIARRIPPKPGKPGKTVTGEEILSEIGKDITIPCGKNTEIIENNTVLRAVKTGIVYECNGCIHVGELLEIKKDVDFSVGNIKYSGSVIVRGSIKPGFVVEADGDVEITGEVEAATVTSRNGFVTIGKGIHGKGVTTIFGKKGISISFAQESTLKTEGILSVEKHLLHCQCVCESIEADTIGSTIIGGTIKVFSSADVYHIGNDKHVETNIQFIDKNKMKYMQQIEELKELREKVIKQIEPVQRELKSKTAMLKRVGENITDRHRQELKKWVDMFNNLNSKIQFIDKKLGKITEEMESPKNYNGYLRVKGTIFPGVILDMYGISKKIIKNSFANKTFRMQGTSVQTEG